MIIKKKYFIFDFDKNNVCIFFSVRLSVKIINSSVVIGRFEQNLTFIRVDCLVGGNQIGRLDFDERPATATTQQNVNKILR